MTENRCRKCGATIESKHLWCKWCRKEVDRELRGEQNEGFDYYFIYYQEYEKGRYQQKKPMWNALTVEKL